MKKLISLLIISVVFAACSPEKQSSNLALTKSKNLTGLKAQKDEKIQQMNLLKKELNEINKAILTLDPDEKLPLVTSFSLTPENLNHYIEVQGNIQTRQNILLYPEYNGRLEQLYVKEGQRVKKRSFIGTN
jgi:multidrug efflux pump subunit AcrA (membrane-fusion protein)